MSAYRTLLPVILALLATPALAAPVAVDPSEGPSAALAGNALSPPEPFRAIPRAAPWERARWHVQKRLGAGMDALPMDALAAARKARAGLRRSNAAASYAERAGHSSPGSHPKAPAAWEPLGPTEKGGRTRRIIFDSTGTALAAGVSGGVWRREGDRWVPLGDRLVNVNIGALAVAPDDDAVLYAGTGELYRRTNRPYANMTGAGIFKSTNGGRDWIQLSATVSDDFAYVSDIVISASDPRRLFAATNSGVWRSDDGGVSFVHTLSTVEGGTPRFEGCTDLALTGDPGGAEDQVLATCASRSTDDRYHLPGLLPEACGGLPCDGRIYLNADAGGGDAWELVLTEPGMGRSSLAVFPGDPSIVYALAASTRPGPDKTGDGFGDYDNGLHAVFRSDDGGRSWAATLRNSDPDPVSTWLLAFAWQARVDGATPYSAGWYNQAIAVDPEDPDVVYVGGMQLYRSDDGGRRFGVLSNYYADAEVPGSEGPYMHPDVHALTFDARGRLWVGNDGGVWITDDPRARADFVNDGYRELLPAGPRFDAEVSGYTTTQFYHGSVSPDGRTLLGGMQDNGTDALNLPGFPGWVNVLGGDGAITAIDAATPNYYVAYQNANLFRIDGDYQYHYLGDALRAQALDRDEFLFITPYVVDPGQPSRLFLAGKRLFRSPDFGASWVRASAGFGTGFRDKASAIAVSPTRPGSVLVGTGRAIHRGLFANFSAEFASMPSTQPREGWVSSLTFDPRDAQVAYATYSSLGGDHVWKSVDGGASFSPIDGEPGSAGRLPDVPVHSLAVDPVDPDRLYVGTDLGVFFSADGGAQWQVEETGFGGAIVERLVINEPTDAGTAWLYAFTYGRGVWRAPLADVDGRPAYAPGPEISGFWYDAEAPGHGLQVQLVDDGGQPRLLVAWYVYLAGEPLWLIGVGDIERDRAVVPMTVTGGARFGAAFDPADVTREPWGTLTLAFASAEDLSLRWESPYGPGPSAGEAGSLRLVKLSNPTEVSVPGTSVGLCTSGVYWNPAEDGQGLLLETVRQAGRAALAWSWYHYRDGRQLWLVGSGPFDGSQVVSDAFRGAAGEFPPAFRTEAAQVEPWGELNFEFTGERAFTLRWTPVGQPEEPGSLTFEQLLPLAGRGCAGG